MFLLLWFGVTCTAVSDITVNRRASPIDPARVSLAGVIERVGSDPEALFSFVRDDISFDVYEGALRGPRGTLLSLSGNSVDQALLLRALLDKAGQTARFARGKLSDSQAKSLLQGSGSRLPPPPSNGTIPSSQRRAFDAILERIRTQTQLILTALGAGNIPSSTFSAQPYIAQVRDHVWVQLRTGARWVDLDPSSPDSAPGDAPTADSSVMVNIPDDLYHRLTLRVVLQENRSGAPPERTLLTWEARTADLAGETLLLTHKRRGWSSGNPWSATATAFNVISGSKDSVKPVLSTPEGLQEGEDFEIYPSSKTIGGFEELTGVTFSALAEWIELDLVSPSGETESSKRMIFDRLGFAQRQANGTTPANVPLAGAHPLHNLMSIAIYPGPLLNLDVLAPDAGNVSTSTVSAQMNASVDEIGNTLAGVNHSVTLLSDRLAHALQLGGSAVTYNRYAPRISIANLRQARDKATLSVDIRRNPDRFIPASAQQAADKFKLNVARGVVDGVSETVLVDLLRHDDATQRTTFSTVQVFEQAARQGYATRLWTSGGGAPAGASTDAAARLAADIDAGYLVLAPASTVTVADESRTAWWRIHPDSGATVAVTEDGLHQGDLEYVISTEHGVQSFYIWNTSTGAMVHSQWIMTGVQEAAILAALAGKIVLIF